VPSGPSASSRLPEFERRENRAATVRAMRLSIIYVFGVAAVYLLLAGLARLSSAGTSAGGSADLLAFGVVALVIALAGIVVALGQVPRAVLLGEEETIVVGRFGRQYVFPGRHRLQLTVHQRFPAGLLSPTALESVEIGGGTSRRSFVLEEGLLGARVEAVELDSPAD
jgi:hypothetical protein